MPIESNLVIKTKVRKENKTGFESILGDLQNIEDRLNRLSRQKFTIKLDLDFDPAKLNNLILNALNSQSASSQQTAAGAKAGATAGAAFNQAFQQATSGGAGRGPAPAVSASGGVGGNETVRQTFTQNAETGIFEMSKMEEISRQIVGLEEHRVTVVSTLVEGELKVTKEIQEQTNLLTKATNEEQKRLRILKARQPVKEADIASNRQFAKTRNTELLATGFTEDTAKQVQQTKVLLAGLGAEQERVTGLTRTYTKELANGEVLIVRINELTGAETQKIVKNTSELRRQLQTQVELNAQKKLGENLGFLKKEGFTFNREVGNSLEFVKIAADGATEATARLNVETGKLSTTTRAQTDIQKDQSKALNKLRSDAELLDEANRLLAAGYKELPKITVFNALTGQQEEIRKFFTVTSRSITGLAGELVTLNTAANTSTKTMLNHAQVIRLVGDTWASAAAKVTLWLGATSLVFGTIRGIRSLISTVQELEQNTVLLARVGRELGTDFKSRLEAAKELTDQITELAQATGGSAIEAQKAAAVFLRAGQTQTEALESVRASLIASRIAEIDVSEAATLLSSALQQFGLSGNDLLPILDSLNSLSNNYRITTDDLLKSISRAGSIFSTHGGSLEELAAITTVVGQRTARTGAEIGNALKTIQSNLDRLDVREEIFSKLGVTLNGVNGQALTFSDVLLELNSRMDSLSEADQKELTLLIGGVRQRNILTAAIKESQKAIIAENLSLNDSGSALGESIENSKTLEAAVSRLAATFAGLANAVSGPVGEVLSGFANLLTIMLQFINTFAGGVIPKVGISVVAFLALNRALVFVAEKVAQLGFSFAGMAASATTATTSIGRLTAGLAAFKAQAATAGSASTSFAAGISKLSLASGLATAALIGVGFVLSANAEAALTNQQLADERATSLEHEVSAERKKARAIENTTESIARQTVALIELKKQGTNQSRLNELQSGIRAQGQSVGVDLSTVNLQDEQGLKEAVRRSNQAREEQTRNTLRATVKIGAEQRNQLQETVDERRRLERRLRAEQAATRPADAESDAALADLTTGERHRFIAAGTLREAGNIITKPFGGPDLVVQKVKETTLEISKLKDKEKELQDAILKSDTAFKELTETLKLNADELIRFSDAQADLASTTEKANNLIEKQNKLQKSLETALKAPTSGESVKFLNDVVKSINAIDKALSELDALKVPDAVFDKYRDQLKELKEIAQEEFQKIEEAAANTRITFFVGALERDAKFTDSVAKLKQELDRTLEEASPLSAGIAGTGLEESLIKDRVAALQARQDQLLKQKGDGFSAEQAAANNIQLQKDLDRLAELQLDKALALLDTEKNIAIERKKSADEAARALGTLSEEDKIRVRAQAAFFAANPNAQVSINQQFGASAEANKIAQQFFGGRLQKFDNKVRDQSLEGLLNRAGFGVTPEIQKAEQEAAQARAGRTDKQVLDDALNVANQMAELASTLGDALDAARGLAAIANQDQPRTTNRLVDQNGQLNNLNVNVQNNLNLEPLVSAFEKATSKIMDDKIADLANRVQSYIQTKSRPRRPAIAPTPDISE